MNIKKIVLILIVTIFISCFGFGNLKRLTVLPDVLREVSGTEIVRESGLIWMLNDSGNAPILYGVSEKGIIKKEIEIEAKNNDWEDLTSDVFGNLYIADFGNNGNKRKNLTVLKIDKESLMSNERVEVEKINFFYPNQSKFPPKKKHRFFDAESIFYKDSYLYILTKSRVENKFGRTFLYKVPAKKGTYEAEFISEFETCNEFDCSITSADISPDGKRVVLLNHKAILVLYDFKGDDFFSGKIKEIPFNHISQKEAVCFKDNKTLYITDERDHGKGGNLYEFRLSF